MKKLSHYFIKFLEKVWCVYAVFYWMQLYEDYPYSASFDAWMRKSLKEGHKIEILGSHTARFNGRIIWISNVPYAAFHLYESDKKDVSPSRYTKYLMNKQLKKLQREKRKKEIENWR